MKLSLSVGSLTFLLFAKATPLSHRSKLCLITMIMCVLAFAKQDDFFSHDLNQHIGSMLLVVYIIGECCLYCAVGLLKEKTRVFLNSFHCLPQWEAEM